MSDPIDDESFTTDAREKARANALKAGELEALLLKKLEDQLPGMSGKDAAAAARDVSQMKARNLEKLAGLGRSASPGTTDPADLLGSMVRKGYLKITGDAAALGLVPADEDDK